MSGFGQRLRQERETRGVSLEEIAESTKIGTRSLRALEEEDFDKLPGGIFNKGFVRAYSRFLGLDEERTVADFNSAWTEHQVAKGQLQVPSAETEPQPQPQRWLWPIAAIVFTTALVAVSAWLLLKHHQAGRSAFGKQAATVSRPSGATSTGASSSSVENNERPRTPQAPSQATPDSSKLTTPPEASPPPSSPAQGKTSAGANQPKTTAAGSGNQQAKAQNIASENVGVPSALSNASAPIRLELFAHEDSWLSISADGKNLGEEMLTAQRTKKILARKEVRLKLGNVAGVEISFNGKPVNVDGEPRQVKELTFTPEGLRE